MYVAYLTEDDAHPSDGVHTFAVGSTAVEAEANLGKRLLSTGFPEADWEAIRAGDTLGFYLFVESTED